VLVDGIIMLCMIVASLNAIRHLVGSQCSCCRAGL